MSEIFKNPLSEPLVLVEWFDAKDGETGWHSIPEIFLEKLATCQSVGWLIKDTKSQITIMSDYCEYGEEKDGGRHITIPGSWVNKIIYLEPKKEKFKMDMTRLLKSVRHNEGYKNTVYLDTLGKRTIGVGHLCVEDFWEDDKEYDEEFLMETLEKDLENAISGAEELLGDTVVHDQCKELIVEMVFQMGKTGVSKFPAMWRALKESTPPDYKTASVEMLDSRWAKQTPQRAKSMAKKMASLA